MAFAKSVWRLLVAIKDGLVLALLLLFFGGLYAALSARPAAPQLREGALLIEMKGAVVEELQKTDLQSVLTGNVGDPELRERDVIRALRGAATDEKIKAVAIDMSKFGGAGFVHAVEIGEAMDVVRKARKPVLVYGTMLGDRGLLIASHASEIWIDPLGGAYVEGLGGQNLYFAKLLERLKISAHVFRVGTYKDFVEPYIRDSMSEPSREARKALLDTIFAQWRENALKARPKAQVDKVVADPVGWFKASGGDAAKASLAAGLVDKIGTRAEWGDAIAKIAGEDKAGDEVPAPGSFAHTTLAAWLAGHPVKKDGRAIGVVTVAGEITDGKAGPGSAGGERIAKLIDAASTQKLAALVVRVDSPGGSVTGSEAIRAAILRQKARGVPVVISMANVAASGGYWVSTSGAKIFAQPGTITGSIGIFAVIPSFERAMEGWGVKGDGVRTGPLAGQPDVLTGLTPEIEQILQANIESGYGRFVGLVAASRKKTPEEVDRIAQGRVWDGGTARQIGLVDGFGGLDAALADAAGRAGIKDGAWHTVWLGDELSPVDQILRQFGAQDNEAGSEDDAALDWVGMVTQRQRTRLASAVVGAQRLMAVRGAQAYCLECEAGVVDHSGAGQMGQTRSWLMVLARWLAL